MKHLLRTYCVWARVRGMENVMAYVSDRLNQFDAKAKQETGCENCQRVSISHTVTRLPFGGFLVTLISQLELW